MKSDDADLILVMIPKNQMKYETPVNDPVFAAHKPFVYRLPSFTASTTNYLSDWPISALGCKEQVSVPVSESDICTNVLDSIKSALHVLAPPTSAPTLLVYRERSSQRIILALATFNWRLHSFLLRQASYLMFLMRPWRTCRQVTWLERLG